MFTGLLCILPILSPTQAQRKPTKRWRRRIPSDAAGYHAAFGTPFTHVTDPGQQMMCQMKSAIPAFQRIMFVVVTSAAPTSPNTLVNAAPVMVLATAPRRAVQRRFARPRSMAIAVRSSATTKAMLKVRSPEGTAAT